MGAKLSHVVGFDDAPFQPEHRGDVLVVGAVYSALKLEGVLSDRVRRDGANATAVLVRMVSGSRFSRHIQAVLLQGIAFAGFNVVDIRALHERLEVPVVAIVRKRPNIERVRRALLEHVPGGRRKWRILEHTGPVEPAAGLYVHRAGITLASCEALIRRLAVHSALPEPLRTAHMIAGGIVQGESRHRA